MARFITVVLVKAIADHHDAHPNDFREFEDSGVVLATSEGGLVSDVRGEVLHLSRRITDVIDALGCTGVTEAKLPIGDGTRYVVVCMK